MLIYSWFRDNLERCFVAYSKRLAWKWQSRHVARRSAMTSRRSFYRRAGFWSSTTIRTSSSSSGSLPSGIQWWSWWNTFQVSQGYLGFPIFFFRPRNLFVLQGTTPVQFKEMDSKVVRPSYRLITGEQAGRFACGQVGLWLCKFERAGGFVSQGGDCGQSGNM